MVLYLHEQHNFCAVSKSMTFCLVQIENLYFLISLFHAYHINLSSKVIYTTYFIDLQWLKDTVGVKTFKREKKKTNLLFKELPASWSKSCHTTTWSWRETDWRSKESGDRMYGPLLSWWTTPACCGTPTSLQMGGREGADVTLKGLSGHVWSYVLSNCYQ